MHHPILFGLLFGLIATRFLIRRRRWALANAGGCGGRHGCGRGHGHWRGRMFRRGFRDDGGGYDYPPDGWGFRRRGGGDNNNMGQSAAPAGTVSQRVGGVLGALDLNRRQRDEADGVFQSIRAILGERFERWNHVDAALAATGAEPFDRAGAEAALVALAEPDEHKELLDALEHLHNVLTDEQRARLRRAAMA